VKVVIDREQSVWLQFTKHATKLLFDPIDGMKEVASVHFEFPAAQFPIGAQQKMISENPMFEFRQSSFANQAEIGGIFLVFSPPSAAPVLAGHRIQRHLTHMFFSGHAIAKTFPARAKNRS
jgi:hypothetical protein